MGARHAGAGMGFEVADGAGGATGACDVAVLEHEDAVRLDAGILIGLQRDLGPLGAENVVCRATEEIAQRLGEMSQPHRAGRWADLARRARGLAAVADQVGMATLGRVARDVAACAARGDAAALGATLARLDRITHRSLAAVWDMQDFGA